MKSGERRKKSTGSRGAADRPRGGRAAPAAGERLGWGAIFSQLMIWVTSVAGQSQQSATGHSESCGGRGEGNCAQAPLWNMVRLVWVLCNLFPFVRIKSHSSGYPGIGQGTLLQAFPVLHFFPLKSRKNPIVKENFTQHLSQWNTYGIA